MKIEFEHTQTFATAHPDFFVTARFYCEANIIGQHVALLSLHANVGAQFQSSIQELAVPDHGELYTTLCEKALLAVEKWKSENF